MQRQQKQPSLCESRDAGGCDSSSQIANQYYFGYLKSGYILSCRSKNAIERFREKTKGLVKCSSDLHSADPSFIYTHRSKYNLH